MQNQTEIREFLQQRVNELLRQKTERLNKLMIEDSVIRSVDGALAEINNLVLQFLDEKLKGND